MIFRKFGGGSKERADTTQNEARGNLETDSQSQDLSQDNSAGVLESVPAANEIEASGQRSEVRKEPDKLLSEFRAMGMQLHGYHSNVGINERLKEWSNCQYHYCRDRFALAYPDAEKIKSLRRESPTS